MTKSICFDAEHTITGILDRMDFRPAFGGADYIEATFRLPIDARLGAGNHSICPDPASYESAQQPKDEANDG